METSRLTQERIKKYLAQGKRFDGRDPWEFRNLEIETDISNKAEGSVRVKLGKTEVIAGIKMDVSEPYADSQDEGNLMVPAKLLPLSSPRFESGPPKFPAIELGRLVDRVVRESKLINTSKLCIKEGEKVWTVFIDIYSINDDGNLLDAAEIAAVVALKNAKIPKYNEDTGKTVYGELTKESIPLAKHIPLSITIHKVGDNFIVDPTREEEDASEMKVSIGRSEEGIHSMQKGEAKSIKTEDFEKCLEMSEKVYKDIFKKLDKFLK